MLMGKAVIYVTGIVLVSIALIGYVIPVDEGYSIPEVVALCNTDMGQLGQAFSGDIVKACSEFNGLLIGVYGAAILGSVLMIVGAIIPESSKKNKLTCSYCNFVAMSEPELQKHNLENHLDKSPYVCEHCDFVAITEEILLNHYNDKHPDKKKWK